MRRFLGVMLAAMLVFAGCGDDDAEAPAAGSNGNETAAASEGFPVTIDHKRGSTTIESAPEKVVSMGYKDQDFLIALGVTPIATREWFGQQDGALWPWAREALEGEEPQVLSGAEIEYEKIAALQPDLITAIYGGLTAEEYDKLSKIAPVVAQPADTPDYGVSWQDQTRITGEALGRSDEADALVEDVEGQFAQAREDHPDFAGKSAVYGYLQGKDLGAYPSADPRARFMEDLGFETPAAINELAKDQFFAAISAERLDLLDADVLVMTSLENDPATTREAVTKASPTFARVQAVEDGHDLYPDTDTAAALSFASPLSLPAALETLLPQLEKAL